MLLDLSGKKILVTGIANNRSIAWGIAQQLKAAGAELGITYLPDEKVDLNKSQRTGFSFKSACSYHLMFKTLLKLKKFLKPLKINGVNSTD